MTPQAYRDMAYDEVEKPEHYVTDASGIEAHELYRCYPAMVGMVIKYVWRNEKKGGRRSIEKALWYAERSHFEDWETRSPQHARDLIVVIMRTSQNLKLVALCSEVLDAGFNRRERAIALIRRWLA